MSQEGSLEDSAEGFAFFYQLLFDRPLPRHALEDWIIPLYAARDRGLGFVVEAFRGSSKTTTLSIAFVAFRLGLEPHKSILIIQANTQAAQATCQQIADLIENNEGWAQAFPDVVPDREKSWGSRGGFELKRTEMEYSKWRSFCQKERGRDPSLIGFGYRSHGIIGRHPTGLLLVDDIHDENNTRSARELDKVVRILTSTILPTVMPKTWQVFVGTPWTQNDALARLKATGRYAAVATPVYHDAPATNDSPSPGDAKRTDGEYASANVKPETFNVKRTPSDVGRGTSNLSSNLQLETLNIELTWPERFPLEEIENIRQAVGEAEFARMYLLDLTAAEGMNLKAEWLQEYPHEKIQPQWPVVMGVDYASAADQRQGNRRDYFAVAIGRALPGGGIVLVDGYRAQLSQGEAEEQVKLLASQYPTTVMIGVEAIGKGEEFFNLLLRFSGLPLEPLHPGGRSKGERFEIGMAPLFRSKRVMVADVETAFLRSFREEWLRWPQGPHDDTLDAVAWMLHVGQGYLFLNAATEKKPNPLTKLGRR